jgi:hypothetical protein
MTTPNKYIEGIYAIQGFKVTCQSVELDLSSSTIQGKDLEGTFRLVGCTNPKSLTSVQGFQFLNFYMQHTEVCSVSGSKERIPTGEVDFYFSSNGSEVVAGLLQSFATQFSGGGQIS